VTGSVLQPVWQKSGFGAGGLALALQMRLGLINKVVVSWRAVAISKQGEETLLESLLHSDDYNVLNTPVTSVGETLHVELVLSLKKITEMVQYNRHVSLRYTTCALYVLIVEDAQLHRDSARFAKRSFMITHGHPLCQPTRHRCIMTSY